MNVLEYLKTKGYTVSFNGDVINPKGIPLKGYIKTDRNYSIKSISVRFNGKSQPVKVHRLQAYLKFGNKLLEEGLEVRHLNGNSLDNSYNNIGLGTKSQNMMDICPVVRKRKSSLANLKHDHKRIIEDYKNGLKYTQLMKKYNISSKGTISHIINKSYSVNYT